MMDIDVERLVELTHERSVLWDQKDLNYHNRGAVEKAWMEIAQVMKIPPELLKKKWKYLRDQFRVECRKIPQDKFFDSLLTACDCDDFVKWPFFKILFFLKSQIKQAKHKNKLTFNDNGNEEMHYEDDTQQADQVSNCTPVEDNSIGKIFVLENVGSIIHDNHEEMAKPTQTLIETNKERDDDIDDRLQRLETKLDAALALQSKRKYCDEDIDDNRAFFASILPHVKRLTPAKKMLCRIDIQNIVYKHAYPSDRV